MKRYRVYIAGPISKGDPFINVRNAVIWAQRLKEEGHYPFVPHLCALWAMITGDGEYKGWCDYDNAFVIVCEAMVRLPGPSSGADEEELLAGVCGIPVFYTVDAFLDWAKREEDDSSTGVRTTERKDHGSWRGARI